MTTVRKNLKYSGEALYSNGLETGNIQSKHLLCHENFELAEPELVIIRIGGTPEIVNNNNSFRWATPSTNTASIVFVHSGNWFEEGFRLSGFAIKGNSFRVSIYLEPHIYLGLGYCVAIEPNSWFINGALIEEQPAPSFAESGVHIQINFNGE